MIYNEVKQNLFKVDRKEYVLAHNVALDCEMGAGVAGVFRRIYSDMPFLASSNVRIFNLKVGDIFRYVGNRGEVIYNMFTKKQSRSVVNNGITKEEYLEAERKCLEKVRDSMLKYNEKKLAIPKIGSGIDNCPWEDTRNIIYDVFRNTDIEILVCYL